MTIPEEFEADNGMPAKHDYAETHRVVMSILAAAAKKIVG